MYCKYFFPIYYLFIKILSIFLFILSRFLALFRNNFPTTKLYEYFLKCSNIFMVLINPFRIYVCT